MNKQHVEFALKQWATAKGYETIGFYKRGDNDEYGGEIGIHWRDAKTAEDGYHRPVMDFDFCRDLPISDEFKYVAAICEILCIPMRLHEMRDGEFLVMHNSTIDQRLAAYFAAEN